MAETEQSIATRTLRGMFWAYGSYVGGRLLTLVSIAILARVLTPREFGLIALALVFMLLFEMLTDLGVSQALVVAGQDEELEQAETVFVWGLVIGASFSLLTAALSPLTAAFFDQPQLTAVLAVLGLRFFIRSLGMTHFTLAQKRLDFRSRTAAQIADVTTRGITSIALALAGFGVWSLVLGYLVGNCTWVVTIWRMVRWRPRLQPQRSHLRPMLSFGGKITGVSVMTAIGTNMDKLFIGRALGATDLGLYSLGFRLPELLILNLSVVAGQVLFPAFAALSRERLGRSLAVALRYTLMIALPMAVGLAILADPLIFALFGDQWGGSVPAMRVLALYALAVALTIPGGQVLKATGRAGILLMITIPETIMVLAAIWIFVDEGIVAVAACMAGVLGLTALAQTVISMRLIGVGARAAWNAVWAPLVATAGLGAVLLLIESAIDSPWAAIVAGGIAGGVTYLGLLWLFARDALLKLRDTALGRGRSEEPRTDLQGTDVVA